MAVIYQNKNGTFCCGVVHKGKYFHIGTVSSREEAVAARRLLKEKLVQDDCRKTVIENLLGEEWLDVIGFSGYYSVSNLGRVRANGRVSYHGKSMSPMILRQYRSQGYLFVGLYGTDGKVKYKRVHVLMCEAFILGSHVPKGHVINHIDRIRDNNILKNLEVVTVRENICHSPNTRKSLSSYIGVTKNGKNGWCARIRINNKPKHIGTFKTEEEAHLAYLKEMENNGIVNKYAVTPQL